MLKNAAASARIFALATKGTRTNEEDRLRILLCNTSAQFLVFDKQNKRQSFKAILARVFRERPDLLVMEGTGLAGGLACLLARICGRTRYVFSSGDAVGPFIAAHSALAGPVFAIYERLLCRLSDGFIGWTPYLTGRAMTFGAPRGVTACGFVPQPLPPSPAASGEGRGEGDFERRTEFNTQKHLHLGTLPKSQEREKIRHSLGIPQNAIVFGIAGALVWNPRRAYCYGQELVDAISKTTRVEVCVLIVGGGTGLNHLKMLAGDRLGKTVFFTDSVPGLEVAKYLAAMDVASLPQSRDGVGMFRYTTKISEYAAAGLPIVTGRLPLAYDLDDGSMWRLPGHAPWSTEYIAAMTGLMNELSPDLLASAKEKVDRIRPEFDQQIQVDRVTRFIDDLLEELPRRTRLAKTEFQIQDIDLVPAQQRGATR